MGRPPLRYPETMRGIPLQSVIVWNSTSPPALPLRINSTCGVCNRDLSLDVSHGRYHDEDTWLAVTHCPNTQCSAVLRYMGFNIEGERFTRLYVDPSYEDARLPMSGIDLAPERIQKSYIDTLATLNSGIPSAVATLARKTLEGIVRLSYPNAESLRDRSLFKLIRDLPQSMDLGRPINELALAMRENSKLSAYFDLEQDTDAETARKMVELLEYLIEYLYVIPRRVGGIKRDFD
ncbi:hypothetical protein Q0M94_07355 [Deinococcus radiomollis]|uniref:hypothetical protein n=1 Tax=Deinococcus radiomollis TaxID=468916 RepID=UPI003891C1DC